MSVFGVSGHRTDGIFGRYDESDRLRLVGFAEATLVEQKPDTVISGFAIGWDQAVSEAALRLGIDLVAAIPFVGQEEKWSKEDRARYNEHLARAFHVEIVCTGGFEPWKFQRRNEVVVDTCDLLGTLWSGSNGGTKNCIDYATKVHRPMLPLWARWLVWP